MSIETKRMIIRPCVKSNDSFINQSNKIMKIIIIIIKLMFYINIYRVLLYLNIYIRIIVIF